MSGGSDDDYRIIAWNRGASRIYGYTGEEAIGSSYLDLFVEDAARDQSMVDANNLIEGLYVHPVNCLAIDHNKKGEELILLTNVFRYEFEGKGYQAEIAVDLTPSGFMEFLDDGYRARRVGNNREERTLKAFTKHSHDLVERKMRRWTRTFTHEVSSYVALQRKALDEINSDSPGILSQPYYEQIDHATYELQLLSDNFLHSQAREIGLQLPKNPRDLSFPLGDAVDQVARQYRYQAKARGLTIEVETDKVSAQIPLRGTFAAFRQTLSIIVSNAVLYFDERLLAKGESPVIQIKVRKKTRRSFAIDVINKGKIDNADSLFVPHYINEDAPAEGVHLGLSIAKEWVTEVGGTIDVEQADAATVVAKLVWPLSR